jgi:hypothetical protein
LNDQDEDVSKFIPYPPDETQLIWRYMDFTKFVDLLERRALFFARVSALDDPFEGSFPIGQTVLERLKGAFGLAGFAPDAEVRIGPDLDDAWKTMRYWASVNCWHASDYESAAMWKLYAPTSAAVAIRSTVARFRSAVGPAPALPTGFGGTSRVFLGVVEYIDYAKDRIPDGSFAAQFYRKRRSFEHEREFRAMVLQFPRSADGQRVDYERRPDDAGIYIPADLAELVDGVSIAPQAPAWFANLVNRVADKYGLKVTPKQSALDEAPFF